MQNKCESCNKWGTLKDGVRFDRPVMKWLCDDCSDRNKAIETTPQVSVKNLFDHNRSYQDFKVWSKDRDDGPHFAREWLAGQSAIFYQTAEKLDALESERNDLKKALYAAVKITEAQVKELRELKEKLKVERHLTRCIDSNTEIQSMAHEIEQASARLKTSMKLIEEYVDHSESGAVEHKEGCTLSDRARDFLAGNGGSDV